MQESPRNWPDYAQGLVNVLRDPAVIHGFSPSEWETVVSTARSARLLGTLGGRLRRANLLDSVPPWVRRLFESESNVRRFRRQLAEIELGHIETALAKFDGPIILLKGAAYLREGIPSAGDRALADVDLMVPYESIGGVEQMLLDAGWTGEAIDAYDQHYYREWSHELPPLRFPGRPIELDLHHNVAPPTGRIRPDRHAFFADAQRLPGSRFLALCGADQVLHACVHLCQDSDFVNRFRELVDIDDLIERFSEAPTFWADLAARAQRHGMTRPLWYALRFRANILGKTFPPELQEPIRRWSPNAVSRLIMDRLAPRALVPENPAVLKPLAPRLSGILLLTRYFYLRFPLRLLVFHVSVKLRRVIFRRKPD
jgi:Uncharacterised nucleotidyltransferase